MNITISVSCSAHGIASAMALRRPGPSSTSIGKLDRPISPSLLDTRDPQITSHGQVPLNQIPQQECP
jgi:hypothetical protein